jgi:hypothetical protein
MTILELVFFITWGVALLLTAIAYALAERAERQIKELQKKIKNLETQLWIACEDYD